MAAKKQTTGYIQWYVCFTFQKAGRHRFVQIALLMH